MDPRPRQLLAQHIAQYGVALCEQPGRCRGLLQDALQGTYEAELNVLMLVLQHGIVHDLRAEMQAPTRPAGLLGPQLSQKLRGKVPLEEDAARWGIEAWAAALGMRLPSVAPVLAPGAAAPVPPLPGGSPGQAGPSGGKGRWVFPTVLGLVVLFLGLVGWGRLQEERRQLEQARATLDAERRAAGSTPSGTRKEPEPVAPRAIPAVTAGASWSNTLGMGFVLIPAGEFRMGSNTGGDDEKPEHTVRIARPFYLGKYEVTQAQWKAVMDGENPSAYPGDDRPVESVSWDDVQRFLKKLKEREPGVRYRLPTEAEWEYAARGKEARTYPWGNDFDGTRLNFCDRNCEYTWKDSGVNDGYATTAPVGKYPRGESPFGVYDMAGNVWEWVEDFYASDTYKRRATTGNTAVDPAVPSAAVSGRVFRGGSWFDGAGCCRAAYRGNADPGSRHGGLGFRLLREVP